MGLARVGSLEQKVYAAPLSEMSQTNLGPPLHSLIIAGRLQPLEIEYLEQFLSKTYSLSEHNTTK